MITLFDDSENEELCACTSSGEVRGLGSVCYEDFFPYDALRRVREGVSCADRADPIMRKYSNGVVWYCATWWHPVEEMLMPAFAFYDAERRYFQFSHAEGIQYNDFTVYRMLADLSRT